MTWEQLIRIVAIVSTGISVGGFLIKIIRSVTKFVRFFQTLEQRLNELSATNELLSKQLTVMFDEVDKWLKMFEVDK
jgi:hypothetical protein